MTRIMRDSSIAWIGKIPENWEISKVRRLFFRRKEINNKDNPQILSLARDGIKIRDISKNEGQLAESYDKYHVVYENDLLLNPMDLISGANCSLSKINGVISPAYINLVNKRDVNPRYYDYYFKNQYWVNAMFIHGKGVSFDNRWTINSETIMNYYLPIPPTHEQDKIANFLETECKKLDGIIEKNRNSIELMEEYKKSLIDRTIRFGITEHSDNIKGKSWIANYANCIVTPLKYKCKLKTGTTPIDFENDFSQDKIDWFTPSDFSQIELFSSERKLDSYLINEENLYPEGSTLIIGIGGTLGKVGYILKKSYSNQQITALIPHEEINPKYLTYNLISASKYIKDTCPYTTMPILNNAYLKNINICMRNEKDQKNIALFLDNKCSKIDKVIEYRKKIIDRLEEYKKSLIYEAVTGKIEV